MVNPVEGVTGVEGVLVSGDFITMLLGSDIKCPPYSNEVMSETADENSKQPETKHNDATR